MRITKTKIKRVLIKDYGWAMVFDSSLYKSELIDPLITDIIKAIDSILISQGQKSIK